MVHQPCPLCKGARLRQESLAVKINGLNIAEAESLPLPEALDFFRELPPVLTGREQLVATPVLHEITKRLEFLLDVGLSYLTLARNARTLSGGEAQRIRLASQLGSQLSGVLYVLDEPSIGLHQRDNHKLIASLQHLRDIGNTVLVVEHDKDTMLMADEIIDLGPGAGEYGGEIVAKGPASQLGPDSLTAAYLTGRKTVFSNPNQKRKQGNSSTSPSRDAAATTSGTSTYVFRSARSSASPESAVRANRPLSTKPSTRFLHVTSTDPS